jgi:hypothetical protein
MTGRKITAGPVEVVAAAVMMITAAQAAKVKAS